ncbi:MAG TPA: phytoene/squalene synthase family protein [Pseudonocardiaceae bacterium]|nr:phytoene/squalene synthase family protein [Pseudonocardiaceae bacterium]
MAVAGELDRAGLTDPELRASYARCRAIHARYGRTYFLATRLLAPRRRPAVHALYGFARLADEIVDDPRAESARRAGGLDELAESLGRALAGEPHPVLSALADTVRRYRIEPALFTEFLESMRMDLTVTEYRTFADLGRYTRGSAAVIGLQMLPVLGTEQSTVDAESAAAAMGEAFQLTNFLRDVGEDLDRGRLYLPADELAAFGVDRDLLSWSRRTGRPDERIRRALAHLVAHNRAVYRRAEPGIGALAPESRPCVRTAMRLYAGILNEIVDVGYDVLGRRATVPLRRRMAVAVPGYLTAVVARRRVRTPVRTPTPGRGA